MNKEKRKREELGGVLLSSIETFSQITCSKCKVLTTMCMVSDEWEAVERLINEGWTKRGDKCICPKCSAKNKK